ncbi:MAG TPA: Lsm family RNA-binding protein [bacterium]|nr:Lsm family RNA-binding protein [bacterium]
MSIGLRTIASETRVMLNKQVLVVLSNGKKYKGILASLDPETLHICLLDAKEMSGDGKKISRLVLNGSVVSEVAAEEGGLPMRNLYEQLSKIYPNNIRYLEDAETIIVAERVKVYSDGRVEGVGPIAERVKQVVEYFQKETRQ